MPKNQDNKLVQIGAEGVGSRSPRNKKIDGQICDMEIETSEQFDVTVVLR